MCVCEVKHALDGYNSKSRHSMAIKQQNSKTDLRTAAASRLKFT